MTDALVQLLDLTKIPNDICDPIFELDKGFTLDIKKDSISFKYKGKSDQGELCNGTELIFKYVKESQLIKCVKTKSN